MKTLIRLFAILALTGSAIAGVYKVHYSIHGSGKDIIINADSSDDARHKVQDMFPDAVVTGVRRVKQTTLANFRQSFPSSKPVEW